MSRINSSRPTETPPRNSSAGRAVSTSTDAALRGQGERLLVLTVMGAVLAAVVVVGLTVIVSGRLHRLTEISRAQTGAIEALEARIESLESQGAAQPTTRPTRPVDSQPSTRARLRDEAIRQAELLGKLDAQLSTDPDGATQLVDRPAAQRLRDDALAQRRPSAAQPSAALALAEISLLLGDRQLGNELATIAAKGGSSAVRYALSAVPTHLAANDIDAAQYVADLLRDNHADATVHAMLLAEIALARRDFARVDEFLDDSPIADAGSVQERLRIARLMIDRGRFGNAHRVLSPENDAKLAASPRARRLRAILLAAQGSADEGLAAIDALIDESPEDAELRLWRVAALVRGRQFASARALLGATPVAGEPDDAAYWRVRTELDSGNADAAKKLLDASPRSASLMELRGRMLLESVGNGDIRAVLAETASALEEATRLDRGRGASHLLLSIVYARLDRADEARRAVKRAVEIDPIWLEAALEAEILTRIAPVEQLRQWAEG